MNRDVERFIAEHQSQLLAVLVLRTGDRAAAEELAQEALLRLVREWDRVRVMDSPGAWLHRVAANLATSRWRRTRTALAARWRLVESATHVDVDVAEVMALRAELGRLPARQREAMLLRHVAGLSPDGAAAVMGTTPQAVRNLTHRASSQLRARLGKDVR